MLLICKIVKAIYKDENNTLKDPYTIFKLTGANLIRIRLWHSPT